MTVDGRTLRRVPRSHAAGVAVLTAPGPVGVTVTSFTSLSADPPLVSFALAETSSTWGRVADAEWFGIQVLAADQVAVAERFAARGVDRFAPPTSWRPGPHGVPLLDGCLAWLVCSRHGVFRLGDHHLVVGAVEHAEAGESGDGLVHVHGTVRPSHARI